LDGAGQELDAHDALRLLVRRRQGEERSERRGVQGGREEQPAPAARRARRRREQRGQRLGRYWRTARGAQQAAAPRGARSGARAPDEPGAAIVFRLVEANGCLAHALTATT